MWRFNKCKRTAFTISWFIPFLIHSSTKLLPVHRRTLASQRLYDSILNFFSSRLFTAHHSHSIHRYYLREVRIAWVKQQQVTDFFLIFLVGWDWVSWYCGHYWPIVPAPRDRWWWLWINWWIEDWQGKPKYSEKTCPNATLSTTNPTWLYPDLNQGSVTEPNG
jgi:hypothetical protein